MHYCVHEKVQLQLVKTLLGVIPAAAGRGEGDPSMRGIWPAWSPARRDTDREGPRPELEVSRLAGLHAGHISRVRGSPTPRHAVQKGIA